MLGVDREWPGVGAGIGDGDFLVDMASSGRRVMLDVWISSVCGCPTNRTKPGVESTCLMITCPCPFTGPIGRTRSDSDRRCVAAVHETLRIV